MLVDQYDLTNIHLPHLDALIYHERRVEDYQLTVDGNNWITVRDRMLTILTMKRLSLCINNDKYNISSGIHKRRWHGRPHTQRALGSQPGHNEASNSVSNSGLYLQSNKKQHYRNNKGRHNVECFNCHKKGHTRAEFWEKGGAWKASNRRKTTTRSTMALPQLWRWRPMLEHGLWRSRKST